MRDLPPEPLHAVPPGLSHTTITALVSQLPTAQGLLRIAGYYLLSGKAIVVYDVLDEQGARISDLHVEFPRHQPFLPPGTLYPIG
ncbi:MAG TPA: hypothetical protein VFY70_12525 [Thermomicrobiales bacterium]|nr:hypothetical protein [Thermomicrobiales bacterium]